MQDVEESEPKNYFAIALAYYIDKAGRGYETALAIDSGVAQPTINRIKSGKSYGLRENCYRLAVALDTTYEDMLILGKSIDSGQNINHNSDGKPVENTDMWIDLPHDDKDLLNKLRFIRTKDPQRFERLAGRIEATADILETSADEKKELG